MAEFRTLDLAVEFARCCQKVKVPGPIREQLTKASMSVPLNLAEGSAKKSTADRFRFYEMALASFRETETILKIIDYKEIEDLKNKLGAHLVNLMKSRH